MMLVTKQVVVSECIIVVLNSTNRYSREQTHVINFACSRVASGRDASRHDIKHILRGKIRLYLSLLGAVTVVVLFTFATPTLFH